MLMTIVCFILRKQPDLPSWDCIPAYALHEFTRSLSSLQFRRSDQKIWKYRDGFHQLQINYFFSHDPFLPIRPIHHLMPR